MIHEAVMVIAAAASETPRLFFEPLIAIRRAFRERWRRQRVLALGGWAAVKAGKP